MNKTAIISAIGLTIALGFASGSAFAQKGFGEGNPDLTNTIWLRRMEMMKKTMDKNGDGMIDKDEFMAFSDMSAGKGFAMMDMDNDGMLSEEEWMNTNPNLYGSFPYVYNGFF